jgi:hypothetical protein
VKGHELALQTYENRFVVCTNLRKAPLVPFIYIHESATFPSQFHVLQNPLARCTASCLCLDCMFLPVYGLESASAS